MSSQMMEGKVVIVTGSGRGIGREMALQMAAQGARVVVNDVGVSVTGAADDEDPGREVVDAIHSAGGEAVLSRDSVSEWDSAQRIVQQALDSFGRVDAVVNNAGILRDRIFHQMSPEEFDAVIKVHLYGSFYMSRAAITHFREQKSGAFVHMTSTSGLVGNVGQANYAAAKLGIVGLSKSIALDGARYGVRSNCISPFAWSRMVGSIPAADPAQAARVEKIKSMTPAPIAAMATFLASDAAASVNGQIFTVRKNEVFLMSQPRPIRSLHRAEGWTPESLAEHLLPAFTPSFLPLEVSSNVFGWDPV
ncbi:MULTISPECIES: SDR family oxidoreductase [Pseudomonas]|nr:MULTISPECIES: SDR family NAD(P)-dependent oxidoreductase [Pseudomonas]MCJ1878048.1 SDR family oxidoreductase [Pseudomonas nitroreducens]MCJ1894445.1 SDR family oxidoreductase [Pseudomonas nitroreducens]MDG9857726.1 SDR family oxidoreductase [Pseudomonas nitroreducens]MDH1076290.1 SDR family oxidoreductase [Pseudomonas nitroreducens]UCL89794.1 SDR family oxidoreductase [Pseudomonas sp. HS-18]